MLFGLMLVWMRDMVVQGAFFDHKGETAGLGSNINQAFLYGRFYW